MLENWYFILKYHISIVEYNRSTVDLSHGMHGMVRFDRNQISHRIAPRARELRQFYSQNAILPLDLSLGFRESALAATEKFGLRGLGCPALVGPY